MNNITNAHQNHVKTARNGNRATQKALNDHIAGGTKMVVNRECNTV